MSIKNIVHDAELIKLIAGNVAYNDELRKYLWNSINKSKENKAKEAVILAANAITILNSGKQSFSGEDLINVSI